MSSGLRATRIVTDESEMVTRRRRQRRGASVASPGAIGSLDAQFARAKTACDAGSACFWLRTETSGDLLSDLFTIWYLKCRRRFGACFNRTMVQVAAPASFARGGIQQILRLHPEGCSARPPAHSPPRRVSRTRRVIGIAAGPASCAGG